jgi:hypothetical protein
MKKLILGQALLLFLALALQISIEPSTEATIALWSIVVLVAIVLGVVELNSRGQPWKWLMSRLEPHLPPPPRVVVHPAEPAEPQPDPDEEFALAVDDLLDELGTIYGKLDAAYRSSWWAAGTVLPSEAYHKHKREVSKRDSSVREELSKVYVGADLLNHYISEHSEGTKTGWDGEPVGPLNLRQQVQQAEMALNAIRPSK